MKKVRFAEGESMTSLRLMIAWNFALRTARQGLWMSSALDSARFNRRIRQTEIMLDPVLNTSHRDKIYKSRFEKY